jgi:hypothetical protein
VELGTTASWGKCGDLQVDLQAQVEGKRLSRPVQGSLGPPGLHPVPQGEVQRVFQPTTVCIMLTQAISRGWPVHQLDVKNAFLHDTLTKTVYCSQPANFFDPLQTEAGAASLVPLLRLLSLPELRGGQIGHLVVRLLLWHRHCLPTALRR